MNRRSLLTAGILLSVGLNVLLVALLVMEVGRRAVDNDAVGLASEAATVVADPRPTASPLPPERPSATAPAEEIEAPVPTPVAPPHTVVPPTTSTPMPTEPAPTATTEPEPTATPVPPTPTPLPPTPTPVLLTGPDWLQYLNQFRLQADLPPVVENTAWSLGSIDHSRYMVYTGQLWHDEDINSPFFTKTGQAAAKNGNIAATHISMTSYEWAFNFWISAPFHAVPMLDPELHTVGFGTFRDATGSPQVAGTLDIKSGQGEIPVDVEYPVLFPGDGGQAWVLRYSLPEFPFALTSCPGYQQPSGAPIIVQLGAGEVVPQVTTTLLMRGDEQIAHCVFDETTYVNSNARRQETGRRILDERDAIVIMPIAPLEVGHTYSVRVDVNGESITWSFDTILPPGS